MSRNFYNIAVANDAADLPKNAGLGDISQFSHDAQVIIVGTFVGTFQIQAEIAPGVFEQIGADVTTALVTARDLPNGARAVQVNTTAFTSGTAKCYVTGVKDLGS